MPIARRSEEDQTVEMGQASRRSRGEDAVPVPSHSSRHVPRNFRTIRGWGADLDPANRPMSQKALPSNVMTARGDVPAWQEPTHRIHVSNEQPNLTPVFGVSCPPKGLSGLIRDYAYEYGEATNRHWMTLLLADRIDIIESMVTALLEGKPDNIVAEKAWPTRVRFMPRKSLAIAAGIIGVLAVGTFAAMQMDRDE